MKKVLQPRGLIISRKKFEIDNFAQSELLASIHSSFLDERKQILIGNHHEP